MQFPLCPLRDKKVIASVLRQLRILNFTGLFFQSFLKLKLPESLRFWENFQNTRKLNPWAHAITYTNSVESRMLRGL